MPKRVSPLPTRHVDMSAEAIDRRLRDLAAAVQAGHVPPRWEGSKTHTNCANRGKAGEAVKMERVGVEGLGSGRQRERG